MWCSSQRGASISLTRSCRTRVAVQRQASAGLADSSRGSVVSQHPSFTLSAAVKDGRLTFDHERLARLVRRLKDGKYDLIVERHVNSRGLRQHRAYWPCIVKPCSDSSGYEPDEVHEILKRFCNPKTVEIVNKATGEVEEVII